MTRIEVPRGKKLRASYGSREWLERFDERVAALIETYHVAVIEAPERVLIAG
jgi:hypothetical protein